MAISTWLRQIGVSFDTPALSLLALVTVAGWMGNGVAYFTLNPQQFARSLPALLLTVGYLSFSLYSFFLAQPLMGAKKSLNLRFFVNIAMIIDIVAIVMVSTGLVIIITHPNGGSVIGTILCLVGNTVFFGSVVPLALGRRRLEEIDLSGSGATDATVRFVQDA